MNATEETVRRYIEKVHETVREISGRFFNPDLAQKLLHNSLVPAKISCYVSTQFGVAFEYCPAEKTTIETMHNSARVEDLIFQAPKRLRSLNPNFRIAGTDITFVGLTFQDSFPLRLEAENTNVILYDVHLIHDALDWRRDLHYAEIYGDRRATRWSTDAAENRAKDEVLAALLEVKRAEKHGITIDDYVSNFRKKTILLLGSYDPAGKTRLRSISAALEKVGYDPVLVEDIPDFEHYDLLQKVVAIGSVSRFIVIDDSHPSGHLSEVETCRTNRWVTIILRVHDRGSSWTTAAASISSNVILEKDYDPESLQGTLEEATGWAEDRLSELKSKLDILYPWRMKG